MAQQANNNQTVDVLGTVIHKAERIDRLGSVAILAIAVGILTYQYHWQVTYYRELSNLLYMDVTDCMERRMSTQQDGPVTYGVALPPGESDEP